MSGHWTHHDEIEDRDEQQPRDVGDVLGEEVRHAVEAGRRLAPVDDAFVAEVARAGDDGGEADGYGGQGGGHWKLQQRRVLLGQAEAGPGAVDQHAVCDEGGERPELLLERPLREQLELFLERRPLPILRVRQVAAGIGSRR